MLIYTLVPMAVSGLYDAFLYNFNHVGIYMTIEMIVCCQN